jgi:hypothetical protein
MLSPNDEKLTDWEREEHTQVETAKARLAKHTGPWAEFVKAAMSLGFAVPHSMWVTAREDMNWVAEEIEQLNPMAEVLERDSPDSPDIQWEELARPVRDELDVKIDKLIEAAARWRSERPELGS